MRQEFAGDEIAIDEPDSNRRSDDKARKKKNKKSKKSKMSKMSKKIDGLGPHGRERVNSNQTQVADKSNEAEQPNEKRKTDERRRLDAIVSFHVDGDRCVYDLTDTSDTSSEYLMSGGIVSGPLGGSKSFAPCSLPVAKLPHAYQTSKSSVTFDIDIADENTKRQDLMGSSFSSSSVPASSETGTHDVGNAIYDQSITAGGNSQLSQVSIYILFFFFFFFIFLSELRFELESSPIKQ